MKMNCTLSNPLSALSIWACLLVPTSAQALVLSQSPLFLQGSVPPQTMLTISKDQQLYKKAYNDYSDLDDDGQIETTYKHDIDYYGYFDPRKCYVYDSTDKRFEPSSVTANKYCSGEWSGNFLNWAAMARMDAVRKLLYGGMRSLDRNSGDGNGIADGDTSTGTVLERTYLPSDAHSWAKYYDGADIDQLTPYSPTASDTSSTTSRTITNTGSNTVSYTFTLASATGYSTGNFVEVMAGANNYLRGNITSKSGSDITISVANENYSGSGSHSSWTVRNLSTRGITLCNTTLGGSSPQDKSQTNTNLPRLRVAKGNFSLWNANERWQCYWSGEKSASNSNNYGLSGIPAASGNPSLATHGTGTGLGDYFVRVQACVSSLLGTEKCKRYPDGNYKPVGLLQVYGDTDQIHFGLLTGSYAKNISGGVLRKNIGTFTNEVNTTTNGTFTSTVGIVRTLDRMRIYGYNYGDGTYLNAAGDNCGFQLTNITENNCTSWGNPMAESYFEALRYFAGASGPLAAYDYTNAGSKDNTLGLPKPGWTPAVTQTNYCAPLNNLVFNASVSTNDFDLASTAMSAINSSSTAAALANSVGSLEGINGTYFIGANGSINNELCDGKTVSNLGSIYGICPEGPTLLGSYLMPGMAYHARTNRIRTDLTVPSTDTQSLKVATYGIQLATNVPRIPIAFDGSQPAVILQPIYRLNNSAPQGGGALVDMRIVSQSASATVASGTVYVNWEDSEQGGDYDQDMWGLIKYCMTSVANGCGAGSAANSITITTDAIAESTNQPQGFGYTISGTTQDGAHFHSGIENFNYTDPTGVLGCTNCQLNAAPTSVTYTLGSSLATPLEDPLYYAAKWGGFSDANNNKLIDGPAEWDTLKADGSPGQDMVPDNYFLVSNPLGLEIALNSAFLKILKDSSASAVATNSSSLNTGSRVFQGRFSNNTWSGQLLSYQLDPANGSVVSASSAPNLWNPSETPYPEWDAGQEIMAQVGTASDTRLILTTGTGGDGVDFQYANLTTGTGGQQAILNRDHLANVDNCGPERVAFLRGHSAYSGTGTFTCSLTGGATIQKFRERPVSVLGDIVNSNPIYVGPPKAGYSDIDHPGYSNFATNFVNRKPVVYVGANDGMLHGFDVSVDTTNNTPMPSAGSEVIAYVPTMVYDNLSRLTDSSYSGNTTLSNHHYFVDSSPMVADVCTANCTLGSATWKTMLISGLGAGGKGFFALNVTNPDVTTQNTANTPLFTPARAAEIVEWEFKSDVDIGYTLNSAPTKLNNGQAKQIAKFENGRWGVIVGNGYNSASGKAVLYVLFVEGPTGTGGVWQAAGVDYVRIEADAGPNNGLSTPVPFDADGDGLVDTVYAGDVLGNMWKFDLSAATASSWTGVSKVFSAVDPFNVPQPIVNAPEVTLHPTSGMMVLFGTGKFIEAGDNSSTQVQTFYGIHDTGTTVGSRSNLVPMQVSSTTNPRDTVATACVGPCPSPNRGWYLDLPTTGERVTGSPDLVSGLIFFNTFIPSSSPCDFGGTGWLMALRYLDGTLPPAVVFDSNNDGKIDTNDFVAAGKQVGAALGGTTLIKGSAASPIGVGVSSTTSGSTPTTVINFGAGSRGRITWREIVQ